MRNQLLVTRPVQTLDDGYSVDINQPKGGTFLHSLSDYSKETLDCRVSLPIGDIVIPGLNNPIFYITKNPMFLSTGKSIPIITIRLPSIYSLINQALKVVANGMSYDWDRFLENLRTELLDLTWQIIKDKALRTHEGLGFMSIIQANPNQPKDVVCIGVDLAKRVLQMVQTIDRNKFQTITDLDGLVLRTVIRFPAARSEGVKTNMILRVSGIGLCCYLHPEVLKEEFLGDVDGDTAFIEFWDDLKKDSTYLFTDVRIPREITPNNFQSNLSLSNLCFRDFDVLDIYKGLVGKEGIGEVTNAFYRCIIIAHSEFQGTREKRIEFFTRSNRIDLAEELEDSEEGNDLSGSEEEAENRRRFRWVSSRLLMDSFAAFYEACFDARKDTTTLKYIKHFLGAIRNPSESPIDFEYLSHFSWNGIPVEIAPIRTIWESCGGDIIGYVQGLSSQSLFFSGKGFKPRDTNLLPDILFRISDIKTLWKELNNELMIFTD